MQDRKPAARRLTAPLATAALAALWAAAPAGNSEAAVGNTSGNAIVRNTITVSYSDAMGKNGTTASASVDITVTTVSATPSVVTNPSAGTTDGNTATRAYPLRIRTNSNGPRAVALTSNEITSILTNMNAPGANPVVTPSSIFLGATMIDPTDNNGTIATWPVGGSVTFKVPNDGGVPSDVAETGGAIGDGVVNGLKSGDLVYLYGGGGSYYGPFSVGTVTDLPPGSGTTAATDSIQLTNNGTAPYASLATAPGWQILEAKDVTVTVNQGTVADATTAASWTTSFSATMAGAATFDLNPQITTNALMGKIAITKYVRNATKAVAGSNPSPPLTINGTTYSLANGNAFYTSGVSGQPGDTLEYLAVVSNIGTGKSIAVNASDVIPAYSTLVTWGSVSYGSGTGGTIFAHAKLGAPEIDMATGGTGVNTVGFGGSTGTNAGSTMTFNLGAGSAWGSGGALASGETAYVIYQVKIN